MLNDAWEGPSVEADSAEPVCVLRESGYVILRHGEDQLVFDSGPLCPRHLPPHAHADALSFVLWTDGSPLIVDSGTFAYTGPERDRFRGTSAHNTVEVDGRDQCSFWGDFRAGRLPRVGTPRLSREGDVVVVTSYHDGFRRLEDPVIHERMVAWWPVHGVVVLDRLGASQDHQTISRLHLAPGVSLCEGKVGPYEIQVLGDSYGVEQEKSRFSPFLGTEVPNLRLVAQQTLAPGELTGWALLRPGAEVVDLGPSGLVLGSEDDLIRLPVFAG